RIRRHTNRLSGVFLRGPSSMTSTDALIVEDPSELSNQITAPGILKIFGSEICEGAHYKSVLATTHSSAKELVKEALERYGLRKEEAESYVLCDAIGSIGEHQWKTEGFRVVGDNEKPLLLQSLWKPREGLARRFEIQRRSLVEEKTAKEKDTITAGINAQARKLQKSRSRVTSTLIERTTTRSQKLWRSKKQNHIQSQRTLCQMKREETESSDDNTTQYSIHPPHDCPYLLLLQGCSLTQDFIIYLLASPSTVIGRQGDHENEPKADISLFASDIKPRHCYFRRHQVGSPTALCPCQDAVVTRNGEVLTKEVQLNPGDVIGLGQYYLFLFKDPATTSSPTTSNPEEMILCNTCISTCTEPQSPSSKQSLYRDPPLLKSAQGHSLTLNYETEHEDQIIKEIVALGSSSASDRPPLTVAFLLCMCVQYSSTCLHAPDQRKLLLLIASGVQSTIWEITKDLAAVHSDSEDFLQHLSVEEVISGLRPLVVWMSNSLELLHFIQYQLPLILEWRTQMEHGQEDREERDDNREDENFATEETIAVLEEVIMLSFQQCVYYITKALYPTLPGLLDCNLFRENPELELSGGIKQMVEVLTETWRLLLDSQLHPEISSQLIAYLFYFINASLFNLLMDRGSEPGFYQWSRGVQMRANLDLLLDWAHATGLGELALEHTQTLSSAINLLATPRKNLLQASWVSLRSKYPALRPAQLNHLLSLYSPVSPCRHTWTPSVQDHVAAHKTAEILESFDTHHPLVLPDMGYQLQLRQALTDFALREQLDKLKEFISTLSDSPSSEVTAAGDHQVQHVSCMVLTEIALSQVNDQNHISPSTTSPVLPPSPPSPSCPLPPYHLEDFNSSGALLLSQKLRNLELQSRDTESDDTRKVALDPYCLLTPPNTLHIIDHADLVKAEQDKWLKADSETFPWSSDGNQEDESDNYYEDGNDEVFSLELERGERGIGLALVDTRDTLLKVKGLFIRAVVPDSPAARCQKLVPGDRILAVNGISLLGLDYEGGKELIQSSGDRLQLLVARSDWMSKALRSEC
uniref:Si:ch211-176g6.2 n=1 Tax=Sphaeramia orbicularis TaxID=375764 RepID=A0A673ANK4_9TELE